MPSVLLCVCVFVYGTLPITPERLFIDRSTEMLWRVTIGCQAVALALWAFNWWVFQSRAARCALSC